MEKPWLAPRFHIATMVVLPLILNILMTQMIIISAVSLTEFLKTPFYYTYAYESILWSVYHVSLALLAWRFLKSEGDSLREIVEPMENRAWLSMATILGLIGLSVLMFQVVEPMVTKALHGSGSMEQLPNEYRWVPLTLVLYCILVTSLTAGVCEEIASNPCKRHAGNLCLEFRESLGSRYEE